MLPERHFEAPDRAQPGGEALAPAYPPVLRRSGGVPDVQADTRPAEDVDAAAAPTKLAAETEWDVGQGQLEAEALGLRRERRRRVEHEREGRSLQAELGVEQ